MKLKMRCNNTDNGWRIRYYVWTKFGYGLVNVISFVLGFGFSGRRVKNEKRWTKIAVRGFE